MELSNLQKEAIRRYTDSGYISINADLRGDDSGLPEIYTDIFQIDAAIDCSVLTKDLVLYRGVGRDYARVIERRNFSAGDLLIDPAFLSTSRLKARARGFLKHEPGGLLFRIKVSKGSKGLDLTPYSQNPDEQEILLPRDTKLLILGYDADDDVLDLEVI